MSETSTRTGAPPSPPAIAEIDLVPSDLKGELMPYEGAEFDEPRPKPFWRRWNDFPLLVILPICVAAVYLFLVASDRYVSETMFIVRTTGGTDISSLASAGTSGGSGVTGASRASDETYAVNEYVTSRDMVRLLLDHNDLRAILDRPEADPFVRFPNFYSSDDFEHLYGHFQSVIDASLDEGTGITTMRIFAARPEDAKSLAVAVMGYAEALINRLNERAHDDSVRYAQMIVDKAREKTAAIEARMTAFRNGHGTVDPGQESAAALQMIEQLKQEQARLQANLSRQTAVTPNNPGNEPLRRQIESYAAEIDKLHRQVVGTNTSTAAALSAFESLELEKDIAASSLAAALVSLDQARAEAQQQHLYIETIAQPHLPDLAEYPKRFLDLLIVSLVAVGLWLIVRSVRMNALEHAL